MEKERRPAPVPSSKYDERSRGAAAGEDPRDHDSRDPHDPRRDLEHARDHERREHEKRRAADELREQG